MLRATSWLTGLSSASRMLARKAGSAAIARPVSAGLAGSRCRIAPDRAGCSAPGWTGMWNQNVAPAPTALSTPTAPPIFWTSCLTIASPSPVPPNWRVVEPSACRNASKILSRASGRMPIPVSATSKRRSILASPAPWGRFSRAILTEIAPASVNLTALPIRLCRICRSRLGSARTWDGRSPAIWQSSFRPLDLADSACISTVSRARVRRSKSICSKSRWPASIFEKSRMSLMMRSSERAERWMVSAYWRCFSCKGVLSSSSVIPNTPFIGVRISWLMVARNSLFALLAASACSLASRSCSLDFSSSSMAATWAAVRSRTLSSSAVAVWNSA